MAPTTASNDANAKRLRTASSSSQRLQPSLQAASSSSLVEAGNKSLDRVRVSRSTIISSTASSSSTSLPRSVVVHLPQSVQSGVSPTGETQSKQGGDVVSDTGGGAVIFGAEQMQTSSPRLRTLSGSSSGHGRPGAKKRPLTPGSNANTTGAPTIAGSAHPASRSASDVPLPSSRGPTTSVAENTSITPTRRHPRSPSSPSRLGTPPGTMLSSSSPTSTASSNLTPPPHRRPSLASPLPATPIIPSHLPKAAVRNPPPAPLNLTPATSTSTPLRNQPSYHSATGSLSSPHGLAHPYTQSSSSPLSSPSATQQGHHTQRMNSAPTLPSTYASAQGHHPSPSASQSHHTQTQTQQGRAATHAQYASVSRPGSSGLSPDSPSTSAMMKRLLAKPAPILSAHGFGSGASGSESEGGRMGRAVVASSASMRTRTTRTKLRGESPRGGVRSEEEVDRRTGVPSVNFDLDQEGLNRDIALLGRWMARQDVGSAEKVSTASSVPDLKEKEKEKEKEKRIRNVLRRKPSMKDTKATSSPGRASTSSSPSSQSIPKSTFASSSTSSPAPAPRQQQLPPIGSFSPLSISPLGITQETFTIENTAFIHPPSAPRKPHTHNQNQNQNTFTTTASGNGTMHRSASASAVLPTAARSSGLRMPTSVMPSSSSSPLHLHQQQQPIGRSISSHPTPTSTSQHLNIPSSTRSASSRGSSPRRGSPVVSDLLTLSTSASASPSAGANNNRHHPQQHQQLPPPSPLSPLLPPSPLSPTSPSTSTAAKRTSTSLGGKAPTPAASLVEAYKKQEREREERRLAAEKERLERKEERDMALGPSRKMVADAKVLGGGRRHSVSASGMDSLDMDGTKAKTLHTTTTPSRLTAAPVRPGALGGLAAGGSTLTVDSLATASSGPQQISEDEAALNNAGLGFRAIEKLASSVIASSSLTSLTAGPSALPLSDRAQRKEIRILAPRPGSGDCGEEEEEGSVDVTPYYTVFGSSATRVAAADRPAEEGWAVAAYGQGYWDSDVLGRRPPSDQTKEMKEREREGKKESLSRSLSRKVSGRWKKQAGGGVVGALIDEDRHGRGAMRGRASMQERRKAGSTSRRDETDRAAADADARTKMRNRRSLRLSIDKFSDFLDCETPPVPSAASPSVFGRGGGVPVGAGRPRVKEVDLESDCDTECEKEDGGKKLVKGKKDKEKNRDKDKDNATASPSGSTNASGGGNRFWKLMRRLSVSGLKEKHRDLSLSPAPPVPALPKDFYSTMPVLHASRSNDSSLKPNSSTSELKKNKSVSSSPIAATTPPAGALAMPKRGTPAASASQHTKTLPNSSQHRPGTTTRSSSPVSSDATSMRFFHHTPSAPSSTSSFDEERPPPLPNSNVVFLQHIVPPSELGKAHQTDEVVATTTKRTRGISVSTQRMLRPDDDWQIVRSPSVELPTLPPPPRRLASTAPTTTVAATSSEAAEEIDRSESPTIPSFSTEAVVNAFPSRRLSSTLSARSRPSPSSPHATSPTSMLPSPSSVISSAQLVTSLPPPPRPLRSAQRPTPPNAISIRAPLVEEPPLPPMPTPPLADIIPMGRKSESHIQIGRTSPQLSLKRNRRSSGGMSGTSTSTTTTARVQRRRSSSFGGGTTASGSVRSLSLSLTTPPAGTATFTFRELDGGDDRDVDAAKPRRALTEREKAARWEDLLERSAKAGGTLHLAGGARVLASDRLKFSKW
ncbi:hypothetical protein BDN70DRAFT_925201 [Pholiota conissans]|uniref:Uncharacterized protein n=1 Tax=Pholiota conissans TaxID=109636 RepID=A0A9P5YRJ8_9AGAR|nr:hypothetical protein BDN70DRAFT_925201 [Pholiota conissans]